MDPEDFGGPLKILSGVQQIDGQGLQKNTVICFLSNGLQRIHKLIKAAEEKMNGQNSDKEAWLTGDK